MTVPLTDVNGITWNYGRGVPSFIYPSFFATRRIKSPFFRFAVLSDILSATAAPYSVCERRKCTRSTRRIISSPSLRRLTSSRALSTASTSAASAGGRSFKAMFSVARPALPPGGSGVYFAIMDVCRSASFFAISAGNSFNALATFGVHQWRYVLMSIPRPSWRGCCPRWSCLCLLLPFFSARFLPFQIIELAV